MEHQFMWGWPVYWYLFLAGMGAGAIGVSNLIYIRGPAISMRYCKLAKYGAYLGPLAVVGTLLLIFELGRPFRAFNIMTSNIWFKTFNPSPMNYGGWLLLLLGVVSIIYALTFFNWRQLVGGPLGKKLSEWSDSLQAPLAWVCAPLAVATAIYTALLLGSMPSRPLWNTPMIWSLFTVSAFSTGIAGIMLLNRIFHRTDTENPNAEQLFHESGYWLTVSDVALITLELIIIGLFYMFAYVTVLDVGHAIDILWPGGELAPLFWTGVILIGLVIPLVFEAFFLIRAHLSDGHFRVPYVLEIALPITVIIGGFILRYVIVIGGQMTGPIGL